MNEPSSKFASTKIRDLCSLVSSGGTPSRKRPDYFAQDGLGHLWVKSQELLDGSIHETAERISDDGLRNSSARYYPAGTVLLAMYGANVGQLGWLGRPATANQAVCGMVFDPIVAESRYVFYALLCTRDRLKAQAQGAAQQNLNQERIREFEIPLPALPAQRGIASILSAYDDLIENNTRRIAILEEMAQALYREWFVNLRFPGHQDARMVESDIGPIPTGWRIDRLGELAGVNASSLRPQQAPAEIAYVDISAVGVGRIEKIERMRFEQAPGRARRKVQHGDIIWSTVRPNRRSHALILEPPPDLIVSTGFAVISATRVPWSYLYQFATTDEFVGYLTNHATGAAYPAVTARDFENATVVVPSEELMQRYHDFAEPLYAEREVLLRRNHVLRKTRDLLLPKLVSGEIDVSNLDIHIAEAIE